MLAGPERSPCLSGASSLQHYSPAEQQSGEDRMTHSPSIWEHAITGISCMQLLSPASCASSLPRELPSLLGPPPCHTCPGTLVHRCHSMPPCLLSHHLTLQDRIFGWQLVWRSAGDSQQQQQQQQQGQANSGASPASASLHPSFDVAGANGAVVILGSGREQGKPPGGCLCCDVVRACWSPVQEHGTCRGGFSCTEGQ
jgi:hypothetical protein